jgi:diaminohydroxyphosphoribosylaminopyrimidine deaminase/5-amino-6-(5-phosphoribosylamino)uracil reductase
MDDKQREKYMRLALSLACKGAGAVCPNPQVGAVIVKDGKIIGKGYHRRFGGDHAEVVAIKDCLRRGNTAEGAVMFVTLEPCCHHGKTGPCTEAIAQAGIKVVEMATVDDCKLVAGGGAEWLKEHGIEVRIGCCEKETRRLNAGFFKLQKQGRPLVILKWAQSIDGKLAWPEGTTHRWITQEAARRHVHKVRSRCGAILVGIDTVLADDPSLTARVPGARKVRPLRVVLDSELRLPLESKLAQTAHEAGVLVCCTEQAVVGHTEKVRMLRCELGCDVLMLPQHKGFIDLRAVLDELGRRGVTDLLVEGGAKVLNSFLRERLADKVMVYVAPVLIGGESAAAIRLDGAAEKLADVRIEKLGDDVLIEGYVAGGFITS